AKPREEGRRICIEIMQELREMAGVSGVHVMAYRQEEAVAEMVDASGILKERTPWRRDHNQLVEAIETLHLGPRARADLPHHAEPTPAPAE
ncbi:MAG: methylenetetrahydrofolate reductase, partial [Pseudomonadota bacterium]